MNPYDKMRDALVAVRDANYVREENGEDCEGFNVVADDGTGRPLIAVVEEALAEPPRNCDALSADDVKSRFKERMASSDMGLIGENIVEAVNGVVDFLYATEKGGAE